MGLDNGLPLSREPTIIWAKDSLVYIRICAPAINWDTL